MMKIRYALLLSVSCLGLGSLANAGLIPDITPVGKNTSIFTQRGAPAGESPLLVVQGIEKALGFSHAPVNEQEFSCTSYTHLASQSKLLSASVFARRTSSDEAIQSTHPNPLYQEREYQEQATASLPLIGKDRMSRSFQIPAQGARSAILSPINPQLTDGPTASVVPQVADRVKLRQLASVCFITDTSECSGIGGANTPDSSSSGPGSSSSGGECDPADAWCLNNKQRCDWEGYSLSSCPDGQEAVNFCPYDNRFFEKCVCRSDLLECTLPQYGAGAECGGKYERCETDTPRACKELGFTQTGECPELSHPDQTCPYDTNYYDKCICDSDLQTCTSPMKGVGDISCDGKFEQCCNTCPEYTYETIPTGYESAGECESCDGKRYKITEAACTGFPRPGSCDCGYDTSSATCQSGSQTLYKSCKSCCEEACPAGTTEEDPGGCGGSTTNECGTKTCYYPYADCYYDEITCTDEYNIISSDCGEPDPIGYCWCTETYEIISYEVRSDLYSEPHCEEVGRYTGTQESRNWCG